MSSLAPWHFIFQSATLQFSLRSSPILTFAPAGEGSQLSARPSPLGTYTQPPWPRISRRKSCLRRTGKDPKQTTSYSHHFYRTLLQRVHSCSIYKRYLRNNCFCFHWRFRFCSAVNGTGNDSCPSRYLSTLKLKKVHSPNVLKRSV